MPFSTACKPSRADSGHWPPDKSHTEQRKDRGRIQRETLNESNTSREQFVAEETEGGFIESNMLFDCSLGE